MKYGIKRSVYNRLGANETWCKEDGRLQTFDTYDAAWQRAKQLNYNFGEPCVSYIVREIADHDPILLSCNSFFMRQAAD